MTPNTNKRECRCEEDGKIVPLSPYPREGVCELCGLPCHTEPSVEKHCEKCKAYYPEGFDHTCPPWMLAIQKPDTNKRMGGWEEEFDSLMPDLYDVDEHGDITAHRPDKAKAAIKSFIKEKIDLARDEGYEAGLSFNESRRKIMEDAAHSEGFKEGVEKAVGCVEGKFIPYGVEPPSDIDVDKLKTKEEAWCAGRNDCISDVIEALRDLLAQDISSKK